MATETKTEYGYVFDDGEVWDGYDDLDRLTSEIESSHRSADDPHLHDGHYARRTVHIETTEWETVSLRENAGRDDA